MLPSIPQAVFDQNVKFKTLYNDLKVGRLNDDGSTKLIKKQRAQDELKKKLQLARIEQAKTRIVRDSLLSAVGETSELPEDLRQAIQVICAQLDDALTPEDREIVVDDFEFFVENIEQVASALSATILQDAQVVSTVLAAIDDPTSSGAVPVSTLQSRAQALRSANLAQSKGLSLKATQIADVAESAAFVNRELLQASVRILEQSIHGSVSRADRAKAEHLATVARGMELKLAIISHDANPANSLSAAEHNNLGKALQRYATELRHARTDASDGLAAAESKLRNYDSAGKGMEEIAKKYAELHADMVQVEEEIARLREAD